MKSKSASKLLRLHDQELDKKKKQIRRKSKETLKKKNIK